MLAIKLYLSTDVPQDRYKTAGHMSEIQIWRRNNAGRPVISQEYSQRPVSARRTGREYSTTTDRLLINDSELALAGCQLLLSQPNQLFPARLGETSLADPEPLSYML